MNILENFIVFEGLDGAGTTSQAKELEKRLLDRDINTYRTFEPTSSPIGCLIRDTYLSGKCSTTARSLMLLYAADREDHLFGKDGVVKKLEEGKIVISDRYLYSSIAYQGATVSYEEAERLNDFPQPEILFYIDTPLEECIKRIDRRGEKKEIFEKEDFLRRVSENYQKKLNSLDRGVKLFTIDGRLSIDEIAKIALEATLDNIHL